MGKPAREETYDVAPWRRAWEAGNGVRWCREQVVASDAYKEGWDRIFGKSEEE